MEQFSPAPGAGDGAVAIEPKALLNALRRRWFLAVTVGLLCGCSAAAAVYMLVPPAYVASSTIHIAATAPNVLSREHSSTTFETFKRTQMFRSIGRFVLSSALDEPVENKFLQSRYKKIADLPLVKANPYQVNWLQTMVTVGGKQEEFFKISMAYSENPREIAEIVNAVTTVYLRDVANETKIAQKIKINQLQTLLHRMNGEIAEKRREIQNLAKSLGVSTTEAINALQQSEIQLVAHLTGERNQISIALMRLEILHGPMEEEEEEPDKQEDLESNLLDVMVMSEPEIAKKLARAEQLESNIRIFKDALQDQEHRSIVDAQKELDVLQESITKLKVDLRPLVEKNFQEEMKKLRLQGTYPVAEQMKKMKETIAILDAELVKHKVTSQQNMVDSFDLDTMNSDKDKLIAKSAEIASRIQSLEIELEAEDRIKLENKAEVPHIVDMETLYKKCGMAGLGVFGLIVAGIVWFEFQAKRIDSLTDVTNGLNLRIMGALPMMPRWTNKKKSKSKNAKSAFWHSVLTESIDATRTVLIRDANVESTRVVMIASAISGEGKTTLSCHLAASLARVGRKTLLVDCDFRRANVHKVFGVPDKPGLSEVLLGTATLEDAISHSDEDGPSILSAGEFSSELLSALAQDGLGTIFQELRKQFEFVVVDSSPILPVTDSLMVAQHVDAVILSIRRDISRRPKVIATRDKLAMLGVPILGAVVIGLDGDAYSYRGNYYGYGTRYGYGYQYHRSAQSPVQS